MHLRALLKDFLMRVLHDTSPNFIAIDFCHDYEPLTTCKVSELHDELGYDNKSIGVHM